jgi:hypothetical protein
MGNFLLPKVRERWLMAENRASGGFWYSIRIFSIGLKSNWSSPQQQGNDYRKEMISNSDLGFSWCFLMVFTREVGQSFYLFLYAGLLIST